MALFASASGSGDVWIENEHGVVEELTVDAARQLAEMLSAAIDAAAGPMPDLMIEARHIREQDLIRLEPDTETRAGLWGWVGFVSVDGDVVHLLLDDVFTPLDLPVDKIVEVERD